MRFLGGLLHRFLMWLIGPPGDEEQDSLEQEW